MTASAARNGNRQPRLAVIGCGAIAEVHHLPALTGQKSPPADLILVDPNQARLAEVANRFGITRTSNDHRELLGEVDGVVLAVPPFLHHPIAMDFLHAGVHVLCEKPLAESAAEAHEMVAAARAANVALAVNQTRRLFPSYASIRDLIADQELGALRSIRYHDGSEFDWPAASPFHFAQGTRGVLSDKGIHLLDTICWWLGAKPTLVSSQNDSDGGPEAVATVCCRLEECEIEVKVSRLGKLSNRFRIEGERALIECDNEDWNKVTIVQRTGRRQRIRLQTSAQTYNDFSHPLIENFLQVIAGTAQPLVTGASALPGVELLEEAYQRATPYYQPWNSIWDQPSARSA